MALFSRRKKSATDSADAVDTEAVEGAAADLDVAPADATQETVEPAPTVGISVQAFRGVGEQAGPAVSLAPNDPQVPIRKSAVSTPQAPVAARAPETPRTLPLAPASPPEQTETVPGMKDNVLLREALAQVKPGVTNEQLLGVLRQALQGHLYLRVGGDARAQIQEGKPLAVGVIRDGERSFMLGYSSAGAVRDSVNKEKEPTATSAIAQPTTAVLEQVVSGGFTGLIIDNASEEHKVVLPTEVLKKALEQADVAMTLKALLAAPRDEQTAARVAEALATTRTWVAVSDGQGGSPVGIAEAQTADGKRFVQLFTHPLEVVVLGRGDRPLPFTPEQLAKVLISNPGLAGVLIDFAGPSIIVERADLAPVLVLAVDLGD